MKARIRLQKDCIISPIDPRVFGSFIEHLGRAVYTGIYEPGHPTADAFGFRGDVEELIRPLHVTQIRYPGGNFLSGYDWRDGIGPKDKRPVRPDMAWSAIEPNQVGTDEFLQWCERIGAQPMMAVNLGTGTPKDAVELLEYCNDDMHTYWADKRRENGREAPYNVKLWCLGNEMDGPWQICSKTATEYGRIACETAKLMKMFDPTIETVACGSSYRTMPTFGTWEEEVLRQSYPYVVFDKTGTLTQGVFDVTAVHHNELDADKVLEYAALAECASSHPISKSLQKAYGKAIDRSRVTGIEEISGHGITATVDGHSVAAGNAKLMQKLGIEYHDCHCVGTIIHMAIDGVYAGHIVISDIIKPHSAEAIARLKKSGVSKTVMLTGDARRVAEQVAGELGVDEVRSELLPGDKVAEVEKLLAEKAPKDNLAFVGDGINDAPVLTRADIGIAMGAMGSDAAIEAADVVLMDDDPLQIAKAIRISRKCIGIVRQNIVFSLIVKFACLALTAAGITNMWAAIFADVGVMILAVLNAIRALRVHNL